MGVDDLGTFDIPRDLEVDTECRQCRVGTSQFCGNEIGGDARFVAGLSECPHPHIRLVFPRGAPYFGGVPPRPAVDLRRIFTADEVDSHGLDASTAPPPVLLW